MIELFNYPDRCMWGGEANISIYFSKPIEINCNIREI